MIQSIISHSSHLSKTSFFHISFFALVSTFGLVGCGQSTSEQATDNTQHTSTASNDQAQANNQQVVYRVVSNTSYPPFEYLDEQGNIIGFDIDLLNAIGEKEGFQVKFQSTPWLSLFNQLESNQADIVASSVWITDERQQKYGVSNAYFSSPMALMTKIDENSIAPSNYQQIQGKVVAVTTGSENSEFFQQFLQEKNKELHSNTSFLAFKNLTSNKADFVSDAKVRLEYNNQTYANQLNSGDKLAIVTDPAFPVWEWGFVVNKNNQELLGKINQGLESVKTDGTYDKIYHKWFNQADPNAQ